MKSHQRNCTNMSWIRGTIDMVAGTNGTSEGTYRESTSNQRILSRRKQSSQGKSTAIDCPIPSDEPWKHYDIKQTKIYVTEFQNKINKHFSFRVEYLKISDSLHIVKLCVYVLSALWWKMIFCDKGSTLHWFRVMTSVYLLQYSYSRIIVGFLLGTMTYIILRYWSH